MHSHNCTKDLHLFGGSVESCAYEGASTARRILGPKHQEVGEEQRV